MHADETAIARAPLFVLRQAEQLGVDRAAALKAAGLDETQLEDPDARVKVKKVRALWRFVLDTIPDPDLGLRLGSALRVRDGGLVGYLMLHSATLGAALERLVRFFHILEETDPGHLRLAGTAAEYYYRVPPDEALTMRRMVRIWLGELTQQDLELLHDLGPDVLPI